MLGDGVGEDDFLRIDERVLEISEERCGAGGASLIAEEVSSSDFVFVTSFELATAALEARGDDLVLGEGDSLIEIVRVAQGAFFELEDAVVTDFSNSHDFKEVVESSWHEPKELAKFGKGDKWSVEWGERESVDL